MDVEKQQETTLTTASKPAATQKDPKKQEAGRKGAAVRRQKLEALKAELAATKETVYNEVKPTESSSIVPVHPSETHTEEPKHNQGTGWLVGIGIAIIAGAVLYCSPFKRPLATPPVPEGRGVMKADGQLPAKTVTRSIFDME